MTSINHLKPRSILDRHEGLARRGQLPFLMNHWYERMRRFFCIIRIALSSIITVSVTTLIDLRCDDPPTALWSTYAGVLFRDRLFRLSLSDLRTAKLSRLLGT